MKHADLATGMIIEIRKPAHPRVGHFWATVRIGEITERFVEMIYAGESAFIAYGLRCADGRVRDDSGNEILMRKAEKG